VYETCSELDMNIVSNQLADFLIHLQDDIKVMPDYSNVFVKERLVDGQWEEIEDDDI
jgi:hypothetical protein